MSRRDWLNLIWLTTSGMLAGGLAAMGVSFSFPRAPEGKFGSIITIGPVAELPAAGDPPINYPAGKFWLVHTKKGFLALYKACTHLDCMFDWNSQEGRFICPCHGSRFDPAGKVLNGPAPRFLDRFMIQIVSSDGDVIAKTDPDVGGPLPIPSTITKGAVSDTTTPPAVDASLPADALIQVNTGHRIRGMTSGV